MVNLGSGRTAKMVSAVSSHTCAILDDDTLKCWGNNFDGELGYGDTTSRNSPEATAVVDLGSGRTAKMVSAGAGILTRARCDDTLKCWGNNGGQRHPEVACGGIMVSAGAGRCWGDRLGLTSSNSRLISALDAR